MKGPLFFDGPERPDWFWIGYCEIASPDRFVVDEGEVRYIYVPLDAAARWQSRNPRSARNLELVFHPDPVHDARLASRREKYLQRAEASLAVWDHAKAQAAPAPVVPGVDTDLLRRFQKEHPKCASARAKIN